MHKKGIASAIKVKLSVEINTPRLRESKTMNVNPFVLNGYIDDNFFCDREKETALLREYMENGINVTLISPRRIGKTGLVEHLFHQKDISGNYYCFLVDIYATKTFEELVQQLGRTIVRTLMSRGERAVKAFVEYVKSLRPTMSFDSAGNPSWSLAAGAPLSPEQSLEEIFSYFDKADKPCIVAINEFQTIAGYQGVKAEAMLRTFVQHCRNARFIFSGSHRTMMTEMFTKHSRPFYQSTTIMSVPKIDREIYTDFACRLFNINDKELERNVAHEVYDMFDGTTWYLQRVMNKLYSMTSTGGCCTSEYTSKAINAILDENSAAYEALLYQIPSKQKALLMAICNEGKAQSIMSAAFIRRHGLQSTSSVQSAIKGLMERDFVTFEGGIYEVYEKLFALWLTRNY